MRVKDPQKNKDKGVVYRIPCWVCSEVYTGEMGIKTFEDRIYRARTCKWAL